MARKAKNASVKVAASVRRRGVVETGKAGKRFLVRRLAPAVAPPAAQPSLQQRRELPTLVAGAERHWPCSLVLIGDESQPRDYHYGVRQLQSLAAAAGVTAHAVDQVDAAQVRSYQQLGSVVAVRSLLDADALAAVVAESARLNQRLLIDGYPDHAFDGHARAVPIWTTQRQAALGDARGKGHLLEPGIDDEMVRLAQLIEEDPQVLRWRAMGERPFVIAYVPHGQAEDLAVAAEALVEVLQPNPGIVIRSLGTTVVPNEMRRIEHRVQPTYFDTFGEYLRTLAMSDVVIAPLTPVPANQILAPTLYLECGLLGLPLLASPTVYSDHVVEGITALIAADRDEWVQALRFLLEDPRARARLGTAARADTERMKLHHRSGPQFAAMWSGLCAAGRGADAA